MIAFRVGVDHQVVVDALTRLLSAVDQWDADLLEPKVDLIRASTVDTELQAAREHAARVLERGA